MRKSKIRLAFICDKCEKEQTPNKKDSTENWLVFDIIPCECGGTFKLKEVEKEVT